MTRMDRGDLQVIFTRLECRPMAQDCHASSSAECPLLGVTRTWLKAAVVPPFDPSKMTERRGAQVPLPARPLSYFRRGGIDIGLSAA
jgi:hypothetical protein